MEAANQPSKETMEKLRISRYNDRSEIEKHYSEIERDKEVKRKLINAYGPRVAQFNRRL